MKTSAVQIFILRLAIGALFLSLGIGKIRSGWLNGPEDLNQSLNNFRQHATGLQMEYLDRVAIPYSGVWTRIMAIAETSLGVSLLIGLLTRLSTLLGIFMVLNFHAATGNLFSLNFFGSPWAALLIASLLVVFLAQGGRWGGLDALFAGSSSKSILW